MPPKLRSRTPTTVNGPSPRVLSGNVAQRPTGSASAVKPVQRPSYASKSSNLTAFGRNDMETYFESLLALDRSDGLDAIGTKGIARLCEDLCIAKDSFEMYTLIWKMNITRGECIPRTDWLSTMYTYKVEQLLNLRMLLSEWVKEAKSTAFNEFYSHLYDFIRGEDARLMPTDRAIKVWGILFEHDPRIKSWIQWYSLVYMRDVTRDVWQQLGLFLSKVPNIEAYRVGDKWSSAIDNYVEWYKSSQ
ncbi:DCN1-like protein 2 [Trypanosoma theileri]|uniref:Defective in cullin neddylation protein n=1 Tax=Trypanosoma theileri TaxID=67003 RepID=A0A1X0PA72_9TRYP|nr:DCN1-like protein 2 [Trypanosoma theileri]ORC93837.1 DCN1-like protein 2 [Trypanosoma theileri]